MDIQSKIQELNEWLKNNPHHQDSTAVLQQKWELERQSELQNEREGTHN
ncbi:hypothetical protein GCM10007424_23410 [Flavobacterium suaedae]|uniref:Uncharacterized protein n=1 Tax=Flavobacterium suaedae TaxID=1767027 RepID=A0ABQ1K279_9FLAO|nr:hypothetical protein [Flavobacterium suaedae]GGB82692.1 hypothetical protein GCM10007424_23410 [Flavobacterium suaedae]